MFGKKRQTAQKEPGLFRQWTTILYERAKTKKALNLLAKQEWSFDFLAAMLVRASRVRGQALEMTVRSPNGASIVITAKEAEEGAAFRDDSIFNHLDDEARVNEFIRQAGRK